MSTAAAQEIRLTGTIRDTTRGPLAGVRLYGTNPQTTVSWTATSDLFGSFTVIVPEPGQYRVAGDHPGYFPLRSQIDVPAEGAEAVFTFEPVREERESLNVTATPDALDLDSPTTRRSIGSPEILNVPYPNTNDLKSALRIIPGVVRDNRGGLHVQGGAEEQTLYTLNGFTVNDPVTGRLETRLSVEAVQSADVNTGALSAEYGKGSAGTLAIRTESGDDRFRYSSTNFVPGFENRKGWTVADWTPRFGVSGPIRRGRAWFSNSSDIQYVKTVVRELPKGEDRVGSLRWSNMLSGRVNLSPTHILHAGMLASQWSAARSGLSALDPRDTTIDRRSRQWFAHIKDQIYTARGWLFEYGYAAHRTFGREIPQGEGLLQYTAFGKRGYYFADSERKASRDQVLANVYVPSFARAGSHQVKAGTDLNRLNYWQNVRRTGFEQFNEAGVRLLQTAYRGTGQFGRSNFEVASYVQDSWRVRPGLAAEVGYRLVWDALVKRWSGAPRAGVVWSPDGRSTKFYAGVSRLFDLNGLRLFTRPQDQVWLTSYFRPDGRLDRGPALSFFTIGARPSRPNYDLVSFGVERHWSQSFSLRGDYAYRRGVRGLTYSNTVDRQHEPAPEWAGEYGARVLDAAFTLTNSRRDVFRSYSVTARQTLRRQYQWMASYTHSRALSNAVVDVNADDPMNAFSNTGPMPWDAPHRFVSWGYLPLVKNHWAVAFLVDARTGFPFSVRNDRGEIQGNPNSERYPTFFEANVHLERRFEFRKHLWALRFGANNVTGRVNPDSVNNIASSSAFRQFFGGTGRSTNFRIRWLGRAKR
jgi:hypothetical protein